MLAGWRTSLVDLSGRNRLLNFRHTKTATLEISYPSAEELVEGLDRGWDFAPLPDEAPEPDESEEPGSTLPAARGYRSPTSRRSPAVRCPRREAIAPAESSRRSARPRPSCARSAACAVSRLSCSTTTVCGPSTSGSACSTGERTRPSPVVTRR
ncbi:DUF4011 domain-containing protein [Streptomyces griseosporeus]|uniref:DUF4011 domain-containing protein n=1 Tax=Streptomyces griseosporeus TaxID=1910 RepID=UPI0036ADA887